jgi:hypothetical protein
MDITNYCPVTQSEIDNDQRPRMPRAQREYKQAVIDKQREAYDNFIINLSAGDSVSVDKTVSYTIKFTLLDIICEIDVNSSFWIYEPEDIGVCFADIVESDPEIIEILYLENKMPSRIRKIVDAEIAKNATLATGYEND